MPGCTFLFASQDCLCDLLFAAPCVELGTDKHRHVFSDCARDEFSPYISERRKDVKFR